MRSSILPREIYYRSRVSPVCLACGSVDGFRSRDNVVYAILSAHASTREADLLFRAWRDFGRPVESWDVLDAWRDTGAQFKNQKASAIADAMLRPLSWYQSNGSNRVALETIRGLGRVKASFAAALNGANVACLDRHMIRDLRAKKNRELESAGVPLQNRDQRLAPKNWKAYRALENVLRARMGISDLFVAQWRRWNVLRETIETHELLWSAPIPDVPF